MVVIFTEALIYILYNTCYSIRIKSINQFTGKNIYTNGIYNKYSLLSSSTLIDNNIY